MPVFNRWEVYGGEIVLWHITESCSGLLPLVSCDDARTSEKFGSDLRRRQWLAWRAALRTLLPDAEVRYDDNGAPRLVSGDGYIGVSHAGEWAVVMLCTHPCAIDIESCGRNFGKIRNRYISATENALITSNIDYAQAIFWSAKETIYKYSGRKELTLLDDIVITGFDMAQSRLYGQFRKLDGSFSDPISITFCEIENNIITWTAVCEEPR